MTHQTSMFQKQIDAYGNESVVLARAGDPTTSKQAAARVDLSKRQGEFYDGLVLCGGEATAMEAAKAAWLSLGYKNISEIETIRKRSLDCVRIGVIERLPDSRNRICKETGFEAHVYRVKA